MPKAKRVGYLVSLVAVLGLVMACGTEEETEQTAVSDEAVPSHEVARESGQSGNAAGVAWTVPGRWQSQKKRPMRVATYQVPVAEGDAEPGECAVFFFGPAQGGSVQANIDRWFNQFEQPGGKGKTTQITVNGLSVTLIDIVGTYLVSMGPMAPRQEPKPDYRMLGAIVSAPEGNVFFKFIGPQKTVGAARTEFQSLIDSLHKI